MKLVGTLTLLYSLEISNFRSQKLEEIGGNEIKFDEFFYYNSQNIPIYSTIYFKIGV